MTNRTAQAPTHPRAILAIILISYFMILLDNSVVFTGLPSIQADMGYSATGLSWVQDAYTLVFGGLLLLGSRLGDLLGRRKVFIGGLVVFSTASMLIGVAPAGWWLIAARALQGVGAAIVAPSSLSLLTASFPEGRERSRAVAWYGAAAGIGASLGMVVGGAAAQWISWRAGFFINVPIGVAMIVLAPRFLPETLRSAGRFDLVGALCATLGMSGIVFGVIHSASHGWITPVTYGSILSGVLLLAQLVRNEARAEQPIMPLRLFGDARRSAAYASRSLYLGAMIGFFYFTTQLMQNVFGFTAFQAGVAFFPMTIVNFIVAMGNPRLVARLGNARLLTAGVAVTLLGMVWLSQVDASSSYLTAVALPMVLIGAGQGLAFAPLTAYGLIGVRASDAGAASGLLNTAHQLGMALGLALLVTVSTAGGPSASAAGFATSVSHALLGASVLLSLCLLVVLTVLVPAHRAARRRAPATVQAGEVPGGPAVLDCATAPSRKWADAAA